MLNLCHRQQFKLYVQIVVTNYIPHNIRFSHALDINAALKKIFFFIILVTQAIQAKRIMMSDKSLSRLSFCEC